MQNFFPGKVEVLTCFLKIHSIFKKREPYYLLNQLYIEESCVWVQWAKEDNIRNLIPFLSQVTLHSRTNSCPVVNVNHFPRVQAVDTIEKNVGFDLVELEAAGQSEQEEMEIAAVKESQTSHGISHMHL